MAGQVIGVAGIVVCLLLAVGVIIGRGWAIDQVDAVAASIDDSLARGEPLIARVSERVSDIDARLDNVRAAAAAVAASDSPAPALVAALSERIGEVSEGYLELRASYGEARARIMSTVERLEMLDRIVPGISIPQGPVDALTALDARIQELDATMMQVIGEGGVVESVQAAAQNVADRVAQADALLVQATDLLAEADARLAEARAKVASTADTLSTIISVGSIVLVLLLLYVAVLHWVLFRSATTLRAKDVSA